MEINRVWSMPNKNTFTIKPILEIFNRYKPTNEDAIIIDPFANTSRLATITNDIDIILQSLIQSRGIIEKCAFAV